MFVCGCINTVELGEIAATGAGCDQSPGPPACPEEKEQQQWRCDRAFAEGLLFRDTGERCPRSQRRMFQGGRA